MRTSVKDECNVGRLVVKKIKNSFLQLSHKLNAMVYDLSSDGLSETQQSARTRVREMDRWLSFCKAI